MIRAFAKYYVYWLVFFLIQKPLFMLVNLPLTGDITWLDWLLVPVHAFPLDLSVASYLMVFFGLLLTSMSVVHIRQATRILDIYTGLLLFVCLCAFIGDCGVFPAWGFHLDKTVFIYLSSPKEALACAEWWVWLAGLAALVVLWGGWFWAYRLWMQGWEQALRYSDTTRTRWLQAGGRLLMTALLFLPIRGSVTTSTMNTGRVYFSDNQILNLAAVNPLFNIIESLGENTFDTDKYTYMSSAQAQQLLGELLPSERHTGTQQVLKTQRPDIILFILESFSFNAWEAMPAMQRLASEGIFFANAYASSYRTDRGVVATMSAFPGQPTSSLMTVPYKSQHLPQLSKSLAPHGYNLKFWYGGDEDFTNMRSYLINGGFAERVNDHSFPVSERLSKWGVHDHLLFSRAVREISNRRDSAPHLDIILSLSSHEPFEVPASQRFDNIYLNSIAYTDSCLGAFIDSLRCCPRWDSTLVVLVADHGYPYPATLQNFEPRRYRIPVIFCGGAVDAPVRIDRVCSQTDVVPTLLTQMGIDHSEYLFGKNALDSLSTPFAFYSFNDGFGLITATDTVVVDAKSDRLLLGSHSHAEQQARAFVQRVMETIDGL